MNHNKWNISGKTQGVHNLRSDHYDLVDSYDGYDLFRIPRSTCVYYLSFTMSRGHVVSTLGYGQRYGHTRKDTPTPRDTSAERYPDKGKHTHNWRGMPQQGETNQEGHTCTGRDRANQDATSAKTRPNQERPTRIKRDTGHIPMCWLADEPREHIR